MFDPVTRERRHAVPVHAVATYKARAESAKEHNVTRTMNQRDVAIRERNAELVACLSVVDDVAREAILADLVLNNIPVARSIAGRYSRRYAGRSQFGQDLEQIACLALVRAARDYDPARGHEFLVYAVPWMTGAVRHFFRDDAWVVRPPRQLQENHRQRGTSDPDVSDEAQVETCMRPWSLDSQLPGEPAPLGATLVDDGDRSWDESEARLLLVPHLARLPQRTQHILRRRFAEGRTQREIGEELGISQMQVSRLVKEALLKLRHNLTVAA
jgi:RNA polymerase sigma-B factor